MRVSAPIRAYSVNGPLDTLSYSFDAVMGKSEIKSQIFPEKYLNHLAKSQIFNPHFFLKSQIFQVISQINLKIFL